MPKLKEAKKNGLKVAFSKTEPDKLYRSNVNWDDVDVHFQVFRSGTFVLRS